MLDTHAIAHALTAAELTPAQVDAITAGIAAAAGHDAVDLATREDLATLHTEIAAMETRLTWRLVGAMVAIGAILRFVG